jgi:hypothetical protein
MNAERLRAIARRCRELLRVARQPEIKEQLREWEQEAEAEAETVERSHRKHSPRHASRQSDSGAMMGYDYG